MFIESLVVASVCFGSGNNTACDSSEQAYIKYYKLDSLAQEVGDKVKKKYPSLYFMGVSGAAMFQKKYNAILYRNISAEINFTNPQDERFIIYYKYGF